jgi:hypothetical protein
MNTWTESLSNSASVASSTLQNVLVWRKAMDMNNLGFEDGYLEDNKSDHSEECVHDLVVLANWEIFF